MSNTVAHFLFKANGDSSGTWPWPGPKNWRISKRKIQQSHVLAPPRRNRNTPTGAPRRRESVLFIGTQFSNLYTAVDTPARGRVGCVCGVCVWCLRVSMCSDVLGSLSLRTPVMPLPAPWLSHFAVCLPDLPQTTPQLVQAPPPPCDRPPPIAWA
jgi:hypothetical protein